MMRWASKLLLALSLGVASTAAAKPLYITIPRTFGSQESPAIDLAFAERDPVQLRVLRPQSPEAFIRKQANLRRAYDEPGVLLNPGRYLSRGVNALRAPGTYLLYALGAEYRQQLSDALPARDGNTVAAHKLLRLREGTRKVVDIPADMALVRDSWLNLDLGGNEQQFNVPGFEAWQGRSGYQERHVDLPPLPVGLYMLQLVQGMVEGQGILVVTDLNVQVKQTDGLLLVRVASRDQAAVPGAQVQVLLAGDKKVTGVTDAHGEARLEVQEPRVLVQVTAGKDTAVVDTDFYSTLAVTPEVFIYSDRPIYKPGDTVQFRGVVRKPEGFLASIFAPRQRTVNVALESTVAPVQTSVQVDDYGSFVGSLQVPAEAEGGVLHLHATLDGHGHQSEARVQAYVKPTFFVELQSQQDSIKPGYILKAHARARRYAGGAPANTAYEVYLYRTLLETPSWVDDAGLGGEGSAVTYGGASTMEANLSVPVRLFSSVEARQSQSDFNPEDSWATAPHFDAAGEADISVEVPALSAADARLPFKYTLTVRAKDAEQSSATAGKSFYHADCDVMGQLSTSSKLAIEGSETSLSVRSVGLGGRPQAEVDGTVDYVWTGPEGEEKALRTDSLRTDGNGVWRARWPTDKLGTVTARVTLSDNAQATWHDELALTVVGKGGEAVAAVPDLRASAAAETLAPGGEGAVVAMFPEGWGPGRKNRGSVWVSLVGSSMFSTQRLDFSGKTLVHRFPVERRFGSAVYAQVAYPNGQGRWEERTVPFRVLPTERLLTVRVQPERAEAVPLGPQTVRLHVSDSTGAPVVAQLSVGVVDKAIYALQSEFRPAIVDFFYPLGRNNVSTFFSQEFAGYGYGEYLARLLRGAPRHDFAAIKPPSRQRGDKERDTALWEGRLLTNESGDVSVNFTLPSNPTLWTVTAVAADARGRFGEGTAEFASRGNLTVMAAVPQILRMGDTATGSVRVARTGPSREVEMPLALHAVADGAVDKAEVQQTVQLNPNGEHTVSLALVAKRGGSARLDVGVNFNKETLVARRTLEVLPETVEETLVLSRQGAGELDLKVPAGSTVEHAELTLLPNTVAAALDGLEELVSLPFGDLIDLVATTLPSLAVYRVLDGAGVRHKLDPDSQALLAEARSRALQGVQRILQLSVPDGGFTWFYGYSTPTPELTLLALEGLGFAAQAGLIDAHDARIVAAGKYLEKSTLSAPLDATRTCVLARLYGKDQASQARALLERVAPGDYYSMATAVVAAQQAGIAKEAAVAAKLGPMMEQARANVELTHFSPEQQLFYSFPLRRAALSAVVAEAASYGVVDDTQLVQARARFIDTLADSEKNAPLERGMVLLHSLWLLERDAKSLVDAPPPQVSVDDGFLTPRASGMGFKAPLKPAAGRVKVGNFTGVARVRATLRTPWSALQAKSAGMVLERRHYLLSEQGKAPLQDGAAVAPGSLVYVELTFNARATENAWLRSAYYTLEDAVPAGFEPVQEDKHFEGAPYNLTLRHTALQWRTLSPSHAQFFFNEPAWWQDSPRVVGYVMRAQYPGSYGVPSATLHDLLAPSVSAQTGSMRLSIAKPST